ncbi:MAG: pentapeptide repeat-containing protein [Acidobacteria bacterium]|nr:pentapeptide repeat-containing protein [Acidobacteriota bacterium]
MAKNPRGWSDEQPGERERRVELLREAGLSERGIRRAERRRANVYRETPMERLEKKHFLLAWILRKAFWVVPIVLFFSLCVDPDSPEQKAGASLDNAFDAKCGEAWLSLMVVNDWLYGAVNPTSDQAVENLQRLQGAFLNLEDADEAPSLQALIDDRSPSDEIFEIHDTFFWVVFEGWEDDYTVRDEGADLGFALRAPREGVPAQLVSYFAQIEDRAEDILLMRGGAFPGDGGDDPAKLNTFLLRNELLDRERISLHCDPERDFTELDFSEDEYVGVESPGSDFSRADLSFTDFVSGDLSGSTFGDTGLSFTGFVGTKMHDVLFSDSDVSDLYFDVADLTGARFENVTGLEETFWVKGSRCPDGTVVEVSGDDACGLVSN